MRSICSARTARCELEGVEIHNPDIDGLLPVYVKDPYEGFEVKAFPELTEAELDRYIEANVAAVREVAEAAGGIDVALANHLVMGPAILARAGVGPFAAKIHGSALEYTVKPHPAVPSLRRRGNARPPQASSSAPATRPSRSGRRCRTSSSSRRRLASVPLASTADAFRPRAGRHPRSRLVFVGKLIVSKGVDLLIAAWPLVRARSPDARARARRLWRVRGRPPPPARGSRPR